MDDVGSFFSRYWNVIGAAVLGIAAWAEMRLKIASLWARHQKVTDPEFVQKRAMVEQQLVGAVEQMTKSVGSLDQRVEKLTAKYEEGTKRLWESVEATGNKVAHMEGRMQSLDRKI